MADIATQARHILARERRRQTFAYWVLIVGICTWLAGIAAVIILTLVYAITRIIH